MPELSKGSSLEEYPRNAAGETLAIRNLTFLQATATSSPQTFDLEYPINKNLLNASVEIKDPADLTKYELRTITAINGVSITLDSALVNTYPIGSFLYNVTEQDILDSEITDRTEAHVKMIEQAESLRAD